MKKIMLIFPFLFILTLFYVSANIDCNLTVPSRISNATVGINVTYNTSVTTTNVTVALEAKSASTRNSSYSLIANITNSSATSLRVWNLTFLGAGLVLEDANNYVFRATCYHNGTSSNPDTAVSSEISGVVIDRHRPVTPTGVTYTSPVGDAGTITATINRALANTCYIKFGGGSLVTMVLSGSTCTYTASATSNNPPDGDYQFIVRASDGLNDSLVDTSSQSVTIDAVQSDGGGLLGGTIVASSDGAGQSSIGLKSNPFSSKKYDDKVIAIILIVVVFLYFKNKK